MVILAFSSAGIMGWPFWKELPLLSCVVISLIQLMRLLQPHLMPSEKQLDKLELVTDFYEEQYNKLEKLWFDAENGRKTEEEVQCEFYILKELEKPINKMVSEIIKTDNKRIRRLCEVEVREYLSNVFN